MPQLIEFKNAKCTLNDPIKLPSATGFIWNKKMMLQAHARGYVNSQFMQPESSKYSHAPMPEGKTFMLPEAPIYTDHPGRYFYVLDGENLISLPFEPVRKKAESFKFIQNAASLEWEILNNQIKYQIKVILPLNDVVEMWELKVTNQSGAKRDVKIFPYFTIGYMSWMNQSASYNSDLNSIIGSSIAPYQKLQDYDKQKNFKDKTFLLSEKAPKNYETRRASFEGVGGLNNPSMIFTGLENGNANYETPCAAMEFDLCIEPDETYSNLFLFGPAFDENEISDLKAKFLSRDKFSLLEIELSEYVKNGAQNIEIETPDNHFNEFVNHWLGRQIFYHGDTNRLTTDPQTRNYLQDAMGMVFIDPIRAKQTLLNALEQQNEDGSMPDGIKLHKNVELTYINQIPHSDHCVWLINLLETYLNETNDFSILEIELKDQNGQNKQVRERINCAMDWLIANRDHRGLSYIAQGDWNDPMNMVGHKGIGVSGMLSLSVAYVLKIWAKLDKNHFYQEKSDEFIKNCNKHLWHKSWYARGITDDGLKFGIEEDLEGKIYLNPQAFAFMAGAADKEMQSSILKAISEHLDTEFGAQILAPAYTKMREDVGRLTQKSPGVAENGAIYNHASAFYIYSLYCIDENDRAFNELRKMITGPEEEAYLKRGQLPIFIPNYYRGAVRQFPNTAGRSSQLFNTGTVAWVYRAIIEGLFGLTGCKEGLIISPKFPIGWENARIKKKFRDCIIEIKYRKGIPNIKCQDLQIDGQIVSGFEAGKSYSIEVSF